MKHSRKKIYLSLLIPVYLLLTVRALLIPPQSTPTRNTVIVAHRSGGAAQAENSLEGLEYAIRLGCDASEVDVQRTADGQYIVHHDKTFQRTARVDRSPTEMTLSEIRALGTAGTGRGAVCSVPTLEEVLDRAKGRIPLFVELKGSSADRQMADDVTAMLRSRKMLSQAVVISFDYRLISQLETEHPEVNTGYLYTVCPLAPASLRCDFLCVRDSAATDRVIGDIHQAGKRALVWTVNRPSAIDHFLNAGVDAIVTDQVELALRARRTRG